MSPNAVLRGMEAQLCTDRVDGQDTETGLFTPVLQHPSSIQGHKRGKAIIPRGDSLSAEVQALVQKQAVSDVRTQDREGGHYSLYFLVPKKNSGPFWIFTV